MSGLTLAADGGWHVPRIPLGGWVDGFLDWVEMVAGDFFGTLNDFVDSVTEGLTTLFTLLPPWGMCIVFALLALWLSGWKLAVISLIGFGFIDALNAFTETMETLSLVLIAPRDGLAVHSPTPEAAEDLVAAGVPHLYAGVVEATGVVGPLVLPGGTGCAHCLLLGRTDRDPHWPRLLAQWRSGQAGRQVQACDLGLASAVAGLAAAHALAFLDGELPSSTGARWEAAAPGLDWHARPVWPHPDCPCGAGERANGQEVSVEAGPHDTMAG